LATAALSDAASFQKKSDHEAPAHPKGPQHHHRFGLLVKEGEQEVVKPAHVAATKKSTKPSHLLYQAHPDSKDHSKVSLEKHQTKPAKDAAPQAHHDAKDKSNKSPEKHQTKPAKVASLIDAAPADSHKGDDRPDENLIDHQVNRGDFPQPEETDAEKQHHKAKKHQRHKHKEVPAAAAGPADVEVPAGPTDLVELPAKPADAQAHQHPKKPIQKKEYDKDARDQVKKMFFEEGQELKEAVKKGSEEKKLMRAEPKPAAADSRVFTEVGQHAAEEEREDLTDMSKIARFDDSLLQYLHKAKVPTDSANIYDPSILPVAPTTTTMMAPEKDKHWRRHEHMPVDNLCKTAQCKEHDDCGGRKGWGCHCSKAVDSRNCFDCRCGESRGVGPTMCGPFSDAELCSR